MKLYRILTENKNYPDILDYLDKHFPDGYTIISANGAWYGTREKSLVIEIVYRDGKPDTSLPSDIGKLVYHLKKHNNQQAVMVQVLDITEWIL